MNDEKMIENTELSSDEQEVRTEIQDTHLEKLETQEAGESPSNEKCSEFEIDKSEPEPKNVTTEAQGAEKMKETMKKTLEEKLKEFDQSRFQTVCIESEVRNFEKAGAISVINSRKNGKRLTISKEQLAKIGNPQAVKIDLNDDELAVTAVLPDAPKSFKLRRIGGKGAVYKYKLVEMITKKYNLDFTHRVSITFDEFDYQMSGDKMVLIVKMIKNNKDNAESLEEVLHS